MGEKEQLCREGEIDREKRGEGERVELWTVFNLESEPGSETQTGQTFFNTRNTGALKAICVRKEP